MSVSDDAPGQWVMVCHTPEGERYLFSYDPEAHDGRGAATYVSHAATAMKFDSAEAVIKLWRTQSKTRPLRDDGLFNRPLTAITIEPRRIR